MTRDRPRPTVRQQTPSGRPPGSRGGVRHHRQAASGEAGHGPARRLEQGRKPPLRQPGGRASRAAGDVRTMAVIVPPAAARGPVSRSASGSGRVRRSWPTACCRPGGPAARRRWGRSGRDGCSQRSRRIPAVGEPQKSPTDDQSYWFRHPAPVPPGRAPSRALGGAPCRACAAVQARRDKQAGRHGPVAVTAPRGMLSHGRPRTRRAGACEDAVRADLPGRGR